MPRTKVAAERQSGAFVVGSRRSSHGMPVDSPSSCISIFVRLSRWNIRRQMALLSSADWKIPWKRCFPLRLIDSRTCFERTNAASSCSSRNRSIYQQRSDDRVAGSWRWKAPDAHNGLLSGSSSSSAKVSSAPSIVVESLRVVSGVTGMTVDFISSVRKLTQVSS